MAREIFWQRLSKTSIWWAGKRRPGKQRSRRCELTRSNAGGPYGRECHFQGLTPNVIFLPHMHISTFAKCILRPPALLLFGLLFGHVLTSAQNPSAQSQSPTSSKPVRHDSVEVVARLSPEEVEEGKLNDAYEQIAQLQRKGACTTAIIQRYRSKVIPLAVKATFNVPRNKFLFLANRDIGNCYMAQRRYEEAEESFRKIMEYLPVWPGTDDSDYPINFRQIATAQMGQQRWEAAEDSDRKSVE